MDEDDLGVPGHWYEGRPCQTGLTSGAAQCAIAQCQRKTIASTPCGCWMMALSAASEIASETASESGFGDEGQWG